MSIRMNFWVHDGRKLALVCSFWLLAILPSCAQHQHINESTFCKTLNINNETCLRFHIVEIQYGKYKKPFSIGGFIFFGTISYVIFHSIPALSFVFPESCLFIVLGVVTGFIFYYGIGVHDLVMSSDLFFKFLLPPIVIEAGYFLPRQYFIRNFASIIVFALLGTILTTCIIGASYCLLPINKDLGVYGKMTYASILSAVDPVAVLAVFHHLNVDPLLNIIMLGESIFNDAVSVSLNEIFIQLTEIDHCSLIQCERSSLSKGMYLSVIAFIVIPVASVILGLCFGSLASFFTRLTKYTPMMETLMIMSLSFISFWTSQMLSFSGIITTVTATIVMRYYVEQNIGLGSNSDITIKYIIKMVATTSENVIFLFLGMHLIRIDMKSYDKKLIAFTIVSCFIARFMTVFPLCWLCNRWRRYKLSKYDALVISYSGLRGAMAFSLVSIVPEVLFIAKPKMETAVIYLILFTMFIQGSTLKPLLNFIKRKKISDTAALAKKNRRIYSFSRSTCIQHPKFKMATSLTVISEQESSSVLNKNHGKEKVDLRPKPSNEQISDPMSTNIFHPYEGKTKSEPSSSSSDSFVQEITQQTTSPGRQSGSHVALALQNFLTKLLGYAEACRAVNSDDFSESASNLLLVYIHHCTIALMVDGVCTIIDNPNGNMIKAKLLRYSKKIFLRSTPPHQHQPHHHHHRHSHKHRATQPGIQNQPKYKTSQQAIQSNQGKLRTLKKLSHHRHHAFSVHVNPDINFHRKTFHPHVLSVVKQHDEEVCEEENVRRNSNCDSVSESASIPEASNDKLTSQSLGLSTDTSSQHKKTEL